MFNSQSISLKKLGSLNCFSIFRFKYQYQFPSFFSNGKDDEDGDKFGKRSQKIWDKLESQNKKTTETPTQFFSNKKAKSEK